MDRVKTRVRNDEKKWLQEARSKICEKEIIAKIDPQQQQDSAVNLELN